MKDSTDSCTIYTAADLDRISPYVTSPTGPVFALRNLPETVKGALFARYSRTSKPLRRLLIDEFIKDDAVPPSDVAVGRARARSFYARVLDEFGDDSVAQLGGAHLACEDASNILTKVLERGRLGAYLEQSTRYVPYTQKRGGKWRYCVPPELDRHADLRQRYVVTLDRAFEVYSGLFSRLERTLAGQAAKQFGSSPQNPEIHRVAKARALDAVRGLLPAATQSNVGIFASGQAYEHLIMRMRADPRVEVRVYGDLMLAQLRHVIPEFLRRVDHPERGQLWTRYRANNSMKTRELVCELGREIFSVTAVQFWHGSPNDTWSQCALADFDPEGEIKVVAAALYASSRHADHRLLAWARQATPDQRSRVLRAYVGNRKNRRHKPGRAFERTSYTFDVVTDYGAFRDLQRHRMLTIEWQDLSPALGSVVPRDIADLGASRQWTEVMEDSRGLYRDIFDAGLVHVAPYALCMGYRVRFCMHMNAREAMHMIELRSTPQGHSAYRSVAQDMHRLIRDQAGHRGIAAAMRFVDYETYEFDRLAEKSSTAAGSEGERPTRVDHVPRAVEAFAAPAEGAEIQSTPAERAVETDIRPDYYQQRFTLADGEQITVEPVDIIDAVSLGYHAGTVLAYLWRLGAKDGEEDSRDDVKKAVFFVRRWDRHGRAYATAERDVMQALENALLDLASASHTSAEARSVVRPHLARIVAAHAQDLSEFYCRGHHED